MFIGLTTALGRGPAGFTRTTNLTTTTGDGTRVAFDLYLPAVPNAHRGAVVLGHGVMVNKEVMRLLASELANAGFVAAALDFRGHGRSGGNFNSVAERIVGGVDASSLERATDLLDLTALAAEVAAVKQYLAARPDVNASNLGYVGYSMGGGAGFAALQQDGDFRAMVGVAPVPDYRRVNYTRPANLLVILGRWDEAIELDLVLRVMENKTGVPAATIGKALGGSRAWEFGGGSFADGTAARLYVDPWAEHFLAAWDWDFVRETRDWMLRALGWRGGDAFEPLSLAGSAYAWLVPLAFFQVASGVVAFFCVLGPAVEGLVGRADDARERRAGGGEGEDAEGAETGDGEREARPPLLEDVIESADLRGALPRVLGFVALLSFPLMLLAAPLFLAPLVVAAFNLALLLGPSLATLLALRHEARRVDPTVGVRQLLGRRVRTVDARSVAAGLVMGAAFYALLELSVGQFFSLWPAREKWAWVPLYFTVTAFAYSNFVAYFQGLVQEKVEATGSASPRGGRPLPRASLRAGLINYAFTQGFALYVLLLPSALLGNFFLAMFLIPLAPMLLASAAISTTCYARTRNSLVPVLAQSGFVCLMFVTLSMPVNVVALLVAATSA